MDENKQRLLIVDDSRVIRVTARKILKDHFETVEAADGEEAWDIICGDEPVSLVVSDLTMPNLDGFALLEKIRSSHLPNVCDLPVIIITGANDTDATMERARAAGATDFIGKPFDSVHLLARTQAHASSHHATNTLKQENTALEDSSGLDPLTGMVNETAFMERGYQLLSYAIRHNSNLSIYRIEIDHYGELYQQHGEAFAATIAQSVGEILASTIRAEDTAARIGPARFAMLLPGMEKTGIHNLAERINIELGRRTFKAGDDRLPVSLSIGVASPDIRRNTRLDELLVTADQRLGQAIAMGGNQVVFEDNDSTPVLKTIEAAKPEPVMETATVAEPAPEPDAPPEPAFNPFAAGNMEVEEIELSSPVYANAVDDLFDDASQQVQASATSPADPEPEAVNPTDSAYATGVQAEEPASDTPYDAGSSSPEKPHLQLMPLPTVPANDTSTDADAEGASVAHSAENTISPPFSVHPVGNAANEPNDTAATPDQGTAAWDEDQQLELRRGFLARLRSGLRGLFRRRG
jgi:two-component system cell cycle response regulator